MTVQPSSLFQDQDQYCRECGVFIGSEGLCDDCQDDSPSERIDLAQESEDDYLNDF